VQKSEKINSFELLELEMADLERFWRKTPLGPLGVNEHKENLDPSSHNIQRGKNQFSKIITLK
jgi:hypothetical protein